LNGLKAIVCYRVDLLEFERNPNSPLAPNPHLEGEPPSGLDCPGMSKPRRRSEKRAGSR
jgi:hypothetical protein